MHKSLLRVQDWAPIVQYHHNPYWAELMRIIEEFEELVEAQKKQIVECIRDLTSKRIQLIKQFYDYKTSQLFQNQLKKQTIVIYDNDIAKQFFYGYYSVIDEIVRAVGSNPRIFAQIIASSSLKKLESIDFFQNIIYNLYPCYLPTEIQIGQQNNCLNFIEQIIGHWNYSIDLGRPKNYSMIDQIINGINKAPEIVCYVQKISLQFMKQLNKCKMDIFAFDEQALKHEMQVRRTVGATYSAQKKSKWKKLKSYFGNKEQNQLTYHSQTSQIMDPSQIEFDLGQIMKARQQNFFNVVKQTIKAILNEPTPFLLNQMMRFFDAKLRRLSPQTQKNNLVTTYSVKNINASMIQIDQKQVPQLPPISFKKKNLSQQQQNKDFKYYRHYSYFMMTNLIFEQLHNKFTVSHQETGMTPADIQNITEIIRIMSNLFQGFLPEGEKYKNQKIMSQLQMFLPQIPKYYKTILDRSEAQAKSNIQTKQKQVSPTENTSANNPKFSFSIRQILLHLHQNTIILSFNDIRSILSILRSSSKFSLLNLSSWGSQLEFLDSQKYQFLYSPASKRVDFDKKKHENTKILFVFNSQAPTVTEVIKYYTGNESPLKNLPVLTKALMYNSNLQVSESLEINKALSLIQNLPLKQIKYYINKIAVRYNNLYLKNSQVITNKFRETIYNHLNQNIGRKAILLMHRDQLINRIGVTSKLIQYYCDFLQSSQLYDRISETFIYKIKIKAYMRIEKDQLRIYSSINQMKGVHVKSILMNDSEQVTKSFSEDHLLRNSFKNYTSIRDILQSIIRNSITRSAIQSGRRVEEFNEMFTKLCELIVSYIEDFMTKREIFKNLNKDKLAKLVISKLQDQIYAKCHNDSLVQQDTILKKSKLKIDNQQFFSKQLQKLKVDWDFLVQEGCKKLKIIFNSQSISQKLRHFEQLFRTVFTIIGFSIPKNKISAEIINPIIQYLVLRCETDNHYACLYCLQCLKYGSHPQTAYNLILYQSSLVYVNQMMVKDYPLTSSAVV